MISPESVALQSHHIAEKKQYKPQEISQFRSAPGFSKDQSQDASEDIGKDTINGEVNILVQQAR